MALPANALPGLLVVGDSISRGVGLVKMKQTWVYRASTRLNLDPVNISRSAAFVVESPRFVTAIELVGAHPWGGIRASVILLGSNDYTAGVDLERFRASYEDLVEALPAGPIVCITPLPRSDEGPNVSGIELDEYRAVIEEVCAEHVVLRGEDIMEVRHTVDGLHPDARGHRRIFRAVKSALKPLLP